MLDLRFSTKFKRDIKRCQNRNYNLKLLQDTIDILRIPQKLPEKNYEHPLKGIYKGYLECHIKPDWLLVYKTTDTELILARTGSHADIFNSQ